MGLLRRLREHFDISRDPEGYERVTCEVCHGSGLPRATSGAVYSYDACAPLVYCRACGGKGYRLVMRQSSKDP